MSSALGYITLHKEAIKWGSQLFQSVAGSVALYSLIKKCIYSSEAEVSLSASNRVVCYLAQISSICNAAATPWCVAICSRIAPKYLSDSISIRFGPNRIFEQNWKHPRDIISLAGALLALPAAIQSLFYTTLNEGTYTAREFSLEKIEFTL